MYATQTDLNLRITQSELLRLTDENDTGAVVTATVTAALEAADREIDSYLAAVPYSLPLAEAQPLLVPLACDIAIWNLYALDESGAPENRKVRYQEAIKALERIRSGHQKLTVAAASASDSGAEFSGPERLFTRETMRGL